MENRKKKVCILYTGGTIGMIPSDQGYVPARGKLKMVLDKVQAMRHPDLPEWDLIEFDPLLDSSDIAVREWNEMGRTIARLYEDYDGFVVLHGTDTMAYSASALSFMLENLSKPVIFTGSQIPISQLRSDGIDNIVNSVVIAACDLVHEVCLYFDGKLMRGNRTTKLSSDQFGAFASPNFPHLAEAGINIRYFENLLRPAGDRPFHFQQFHEIPIGVLKIFPGIQFELFESIMTEKLKGVVLETFGAGNIPSYNHALLPIIKKAYLSGTIITVCSQCAQGTVSLGAYATSKALQEVDAVSGVDMTTEAAVTKMYYLFSRGLTKEEIKEKMSQDLRGELSR